jgi:acetolactate synthase I/II/III large subunit
MSEEGPSEQEPSERVSVGDAVVDIAATHGTHVFFGVVSIHNQPLVDVINRRARYVPVRHEAAAVNAADAYARASGNLGVAITSTGTGAGNAAGSMIEAQTAGSAVLHVTGQIDSEYLGHGRGVIHEAANQFGMLDAVSKAASTVTTAESAGAVLAEAAVLARADPAGPVSVEIPIDLQYLATTIRRSGRPAVRGPDVDSVARAVELIAGAERPAMWLGGGAVGAGPELVGLAELMGAAVFTSNAGRGTIDERHDAVMGNFAATASGASLLAEADLLISVGTHFRSNETRHYKLPLPGAHVQVDVDANAIGRVHPATVGLVGDAALSVSALLVGLGDRTADAGWVTRISSARAESRAQLRADIGPYAELSDAMRRHMADASPLVRDVTIPASAWGNRLLPIYDPATNVNPRGGGIGQGAAMAVGAALARPSVPTFLMVGDGGLAVHLGELGTIAQESPWLVVVLFNDGGYGVLRNLQDHHFDQRSGVDLFTPDFAALASAHSIEHRLLANPTDCDTVLAEAVGLRRPVVVEVDCDAFGAMPKPFVPPVKVPNR